MTDDRKGSAHAEPKTVRVVTHATVYREPRVRVVGKDANGNEIRQSQIPRAIPRGTELELPVEEAAPLLAARHVRLPNQPPPPSALVTGEQPTGNAPIAREEATP